MGQPIFPRGSKRRVGAIGIEGAEKGCSEANVGGGKRATIKIEDDNFDPITSRQVSLLGAAIAA
jgi:hypothetical protein